MRGSFMESALLAPSASPHSTRSVYMPRGTSAGSVAIIACSLTIAGSRSSEAPLAVALISTRQPERRPDPLARSVELGRTVGVTHERYGLPFEGATAAAERCSRAAIREARIRVLLMGPRGGVPKC